MNKSRKYRRATRVAALPRRIQTDMRPSSPCERELRSLRQAALSKQNRRLGAAAIRAASAALTLGAGRTNGCGAPVSAGSGRNLAGIGRRRGLRQAAHAEHQGQPVDDIAQHLGQRRIAVIAKERLEDLAQS